MSTSRLARGIGPIVDLVGKGGHIRTVPIPRWAKEALDSWTSAAGVTTGRIFRAVSRAGRTWSTGIDENVIWHVVRKRCNQGRLEHIAPRDLRRTCARLCHSAGGDLEQIQFLLGHSSIQTTERYLGCKQNLGQPVNWNPSSAVSCSNQRVYPLASIPIRASMPRARRSR